MQNLTKNLLLLLSLFLISLVFKVDKPVKSAKVKGVFKCVTLNLSKSDCIVYKKVN